MRTGFVIVTYNRSDALLAVLRALAPQCQAGDVIVVADDGSRPEHVRAVAEGAPAAACPVLHLWHPDQGFTAGRARNLGALAAREAGADYIVFMDGDCVPHAGFAAMHRALAQPGAFVNGSRVLLSERLTARVLAGELDLTTLGLVQSLRLRLAGDLNKLAHLVQWPGLAGRRERSFRWRGIRSCNFGLWWDDLAAVNGFDETFSGWGHEDADLVLRLHNQGLVRKNGHLATEVFHLWHREASRQHEAANRARVQARMLEGTRRAAVGLEQARGAGEVKVTPLAPLQGERRT
ncbi:glycosyltransferase [Ramlibacter sp. MAHUQ-53]|uniref:glycosyltransferase n=1 Tax=unclassified Ramlibacter TaxID=2617605 RepID=UPI00362C175A